MQHFMVWDKTQQRLHSGAEDVPLLDAALRCFRQPGDAAVAALESVLADGGDTLLRQCLLVTQVANDVLDEEGQQLSAIFAEKGQPVVCKAGCSRCCRQLVLCRPFEARLIAAFLEASPAALSAFARAYAVWDKATASLRPSYLAWAEGVYGRGEDDGSHVLEDYQQPCPFLDTEGRCGIYAVRPYACRTCIALDPRCPTPPPGHNGLLHMQYSLYTSHHAARQSVTDLLLRRLKASPQSVSMPELVAGYCRRDSAF